MATFEVIPIGEGDASVLTRIGYRAFGDDLLNKRLYNLENATPSQIEEDLQWRITRNSRRMYGPGSHWFKATEIATGKPVGYCGILAPEKGKAKGLDTDDTVPPVTMNSELFALIGEQSKTLRKEHLGERDDYWCESRIPRTRKSGQQLTISRRRAVDGGRAELSRTRHCEAVVAEAVRARRRCWTRHLS